jgi:O-antigen/teichoic acid export membrane protein
MRTGRHFVYNLLGAGLPLLLGVVAIPVIGRQAGYERLGFLTIVWAAIGYLGFLDFGLARVFSRRVALASEAGQLRAEMSFLRWAARRVFALCCVLAVVLALAVPTHWLSGANASPDWRAEVQQAWWILASSIPPLVLASVWRGAMEGRAAFGPVNVLRVGLGVWTFGMPLLLLLWFTQLPILVAGIVLGRWVSLLAHSLWCRRHLPDAGPLEGDAAKHRTAFRRAFMEGGWITVSGVVGPMMVVFDRFVLGSITALSSVAVYSIPQEMVLRMLGVPGLLANVLFPQLAVLAQQGGDDAARLVNRSVRIKLLVMLPVCVGLSVLAEPLLRLWLGAAIAHEAAPVLRCLLVGAIFNTAAQVPFAHLQASGRAWLTARIHLAELLPYGAALFWGCAHHGALGAAWVWSGRCAVDTAALFVANRRLERGAIDAKVVAVMLGSASAVVATALLGGMH